MSVLGLLVVLLVVAAAGYWWWLKQGGQEKEAPPPGSPEGLRVAAESGDAAAACRLGRLYADGLEVEQDWPQAAMWYRKSAQEGNAEGQYQYGQLCESGRGIPQNWEQAAAWYRKAAEKGHADAQWRLGLCHRDGRGVAQDAIWAKLWLEKAAHQGQEEAREALTKLEAGLAEEPPDPVAADRALAEAGDAAAQCRMGRRFMAGDGVDKDEAAGAEWYRKAAEQGYAEGQCRWGDCLQEGRGVAKDAASAETWFRAAAEQGNAAAQRAMGKYRMAAGDRAGSVTWLRDAAIGGDAEGQYLLAVCYQKGLGTAKDPVKAKKWLQNAANNGHAKARAALNAQTSGGGMQELAAQARGGNRQAQFQLGRKLLKQGREKDGVGWIRAAAESGFPDAAIWLAGHFEGNDERQAFYWWSRAADFGSPQAQWRMVDLCRRGEGTTASDTEALRWARKAADGGNQHAMRWVAECYENGVGCTMDYLEARRWYERAGERVDVKRMDRMLEGENSSTGTRRTKYKGIRHYQDNRGQWHVKIN